MPKFIFSKQPRPLGVGVPVFCYHVIDEPTFRADLSFLSQNGYTTLSADDLLAHLTRAQPAPDNSVVLTFDDGQRTLCDVAFPLLKEYNHKAVAFICPGLHREPDAPDAQPDGGLCDWQQIIEMHDSGLVDFQPHTNSHRYIPDWPRPLPMAGVDESVADQRRPPEAALQDDLREAKQTLESRLRKIAKHLAFPQYDGIQDAVTTARALGYRAFYWGVLPGKALNRPGDDSDASDRIVRVSGEFLRRLPGEGRINLRHLLGKRYGKRLS